MERRRVRRLGGVIRETDVYSALKTRVDSDTGSTPLEHLKEMYQGQMDLYRIAVAKLCGLDVGKVRCVLIHVRKGELVEC